MRTSSLMQLAGWSREAAATLGAVLTAVLLPVLHLWPWLLVAAIYVGFLGSDQGASIAADMAETDWASVGALTLATAFLCTLAACLFTSLVVTSFEANWGRRAQVDPSSNELESTTMHRRVASKPKWLIDSKNWFAATRHAIKQGRTLGTLHLAWGLALGAALPLTTILFVGVSGRGTLSVVLIAAIALLAVLLLLRGAWVSAPAWSARISYFHRHRLALGAGILAAAVLPVYVAARSLVNDPLSASATGPALVTMLGLSSLASLFGACFVALPYCLNRPRWGVFAMFVLVTFNVWQLPLADAENPLLAEVTWKARQDAQCQKISEDQAFRSTRRAVIDRAQSVRELKTEEAGPSLLFVSAEGGGIRAAYWSALSLWQLSHEVPEFRSRLTQLTGVSGGSLGIATWLAAADATDSPTDQRQLIEKFLGTDFLSPAIAGLLYLDAPRLIFGQLWPKARRDDVFAAALVNRWGQLAHAGPNFFLRPMVRLCLLRYENPPLIFLDAADALAGSHVGGSNVRDFYQGPRRALSTEIAEAERGLRHRGMAARRTDSVVEAVVNSARFPLLAPAADIAVGMDSVEAAMRRMTYTPRSPNSRGPSISAVDGAASAASASTQWARLGVLVDGGYFDNSGLTRVRQTLASIDRADAGIQVNDVAAYVVHIENDPSAACLSPGDWRVWASAPVRELVERTGFSPMCRHDIEDLQRMLQRRPLSWLASPFEALLSVREEHSYQELAYLQSALAFRAGAGGVFPLSLSEQLTKLRCREFSDDSTAAGCVRRAGYQLRPMARLYCPGLRPLPPLPLGWTLSQGDRDWMGCLSEHAARAVDGRMRAMDKQNFIQAAKREAAPRPSQR